MTGAVAKHQPQEVMAPERSNALTPMEMLDRAVQSGAAPETLEKLMGLQERWEANQARKAFDAAMSAAKSELPVILKNREVDFTSQKGRTNYRYEDLAGIARAIDPILTKNGLSYRYRTTSAVNEPVSVTCIMSHRDGHSEETTLSAGRDESGNKNGIQAIGSTVTYLQRYTLKAALGLAASADDDAKTSEAIALITAEQAKQIERALEFAGADTAKFLKWARVDKIDDIAAAQFQPSLDAIARAAQAKK